MQLIANTCRSLFLIVTKTASLVGDFTAFSASLPRQLPIAIGAVSGYTKKVITATRQTQDTLPSKVSGVQIRLRLLAILFAIALLGVPLTAKVKEGGIVYCKGKTL